MLDRPPTLNQPPTPTPRGMFSRSDVLVALIACALTVGVSMYLLVPQSDLSSQSSRMEEKGPPGPLVVTRVVVRDVKAHPFKADGRRWDAGIKGDPDMRVMVANHNDRTTRWTRTIDDRLFATFDEPTVTAVPGDRLRIRVEDVDMAFHDLVGEHSFVLTNEMIHEGTVEFRFGQVERLRLEFRVER